MNKKFRLSVALDIDDVLMECVPYAIRLANEKYNFDPPLSIHEVDHWGKLGTRADVIFEFFDDPEFFRHQPVMKGAREFVKELSKMTEVFVSTAVRPEFMGIRAVRIMEAFPEIPQDHIYMGSRKDKIDVDILFDDGMHNVFGSTAKYPILLRRPWNNEATGLLSVNNFEEFLKVVEVISDSYSVSAQKDLLQQPGILALVGPSGSGKTQVAKEILKHGEYFEKLISCTTADPLETKGDNWYRYISQEEFRKQCDSGEIFESTIYANHGYGSRKADIEAILAKGKHAVTPMDICGAMALKTHFPNVVTVFVKRDRKELLRSILEKDISMEEKVNRLLAVEGEMQNAEICDYVIKYDTAEGTAERICDALGISSVKKP